MRALVSEISFGKTIVYPTDTCYGLGCDATNQAAVDNIFDIKKRQKDKAVLVVMSDPHMAMQYVEWSPKLEEISEKYWPGPLTVVVRAREHHGLARGVVAEDGTLAFRITGHAFVHELCTKLNKPIVSTSANISSQGSPYDLEHIHAMFDTEEVQPDIVIDAGALPHEAPSTIVRIDGDRIIVLRQGEVVVM